MFKLFRKKQEATDEIATEIKIMIVRGQNLVDQTRQGMKEKSYDLDLTGKLQLKNDCAEMEKLIKEAKCGTDNPKFREKFRLALIRMETTSNALLNRTWMG